MKLKELSIPVGISNRHVHLCGEDIRTLFGEEAELTPVKDLGQPGQYAAAEKVILVGPRGCIEAVRVLGPARKTTQVELSRTDCFKLGLKPPVRDSGDHKASSSLTIVGPEGAAVLEEGVILAKRHIHMRPEEADMLGLKDKDIVSVYCEGDGTRRTIFQDVLVRVNEQYALEFHVDLDEGNAAMLGNGDVVRVAEVL